MTPQSSPRAGEAAAMIPEPNTHLHDGPPRFGPRTEAGRAALRSMRNRYPEGTVGRMVTDEWHAVILAIEAEARAGEAEGGVRRVLDNLLRHHNTMHASDCEFAREARAALASPEPDENPEQRRIRNAPEHSEEGWSR